jgi:4-hydroxybenzoate polyprenyltransferase
MILAGMADQPAAIASAAIAFLAMSLMASGTYLVNDLFDLADDRAHPTKRNRPLASGRLHIKHGVAASLLLIAGSLALAATLGLPTFTLMLIYMATTLGYSFYLKRQPVLDAFTLASLFTLRLGVGITAVGAAPSPWLLVFSMFLFASLAFAKRQSEIQRNLRDGRDVVKGRGYLATDGGIVMPLGIATAMTAINIMVLYIMNDIYSADFYAYPVLLWALPVGLFLWVCRVWLLCHRGQLEDDPVAFALKDPTSLAIGGVMGAAFVGGWLL